jgi:hypothetical protein
MWLENKRIAELVRDIEKQSLAIKHNPPRQIDFASLPEPKIDFTIPFARSLFSPPRKIRMTDAAPQLGEGGFSAEALFSQHYGDEGLLRNQIARMLSENSQVALSDIVEKYPVTRGMAEIVTYINMANREEKSTLNENQRQQILWHDAQGRERYADIPLVIFTRYKGCELFCRGEVAAIFRLNVIAEGVETEKQFELLNTFGCMTYQGCLFRKPVVIDEFEAKQNSNYAAKINSNDI